MMSDLGKKPKKTKKNVEPQISKEIKKKIDLEKLTARPLTLSSRKGSLRKEIYEYVGSLLGRELERKEHDKLKKMILRHDELLSENFILLKQDFQNNIQKNQKMKELLSKRYNKKY
ncbi:MAG: hypothetical protein KAS32_12555 [Candidatus Peribacteraceae bacterium]|nr:hypothetical protein [Candidatus Peribacteraceae bacterium]